MKRAMCLIVGLAMLSSAAAAGTLPAELAARVGNDPKADTPQCLAAKADAEDWTEGGAKKVLKTIGRIAIWPLGERSARRRGRAISADRERLMQRLRDACFTQPVFDRAAPRAGQRWPGGRGYEKRLAFYAQGGGRLILVFVHPDTDTMWLKAADGDPGFQYWTGDQWVGPVAVTLEPLGCQVTEDAPAPSSTREMGFKCPEGVNLRALVASQSEATRAGIPLHL